MYLIKTPWWLRLIYGSFLWRVKTQEKVLYLTFDDGPQEAVTPFVLDQLNKYKAKATFFCIGNNIVKNGAIYQRVLDEGHSVGNHTFHHLNGWKVKSAAYVNDVVEAEKYIDSTLFRPPYGRITKFTAALLQQKGFSIIMWDVLSADFDTSISPEQCLQNVLLHAKEGSIIVFHDSAKAWDRMSYALPLLLAHYTSKGFSFKAL